jgi:GT2 family glycosyltransferase
VIPNDDSWFAPGALEAIAENVDTTAFNFVNVNPRWSCVIPTEGSVEKAGLWDEAFHPIYYDDDDYEWRMKELGVSFHTIEATVHHDNSSTLKSGYQGINSKTFTTNRNRCSKTRWQRTTLAPEAGHLRSGGTTHGTKGLHRRNI